MRESDEQSLGNVTNHRRRKAPIYIGLAILFALGVLLYWRWNANFVKFWRPCIRLGLVFFAKYFLLFDSLCVFVSYTKYRERWNANWEPFVKPWALRIIGITAVIALFVVGPYQKNKRDKDGMRRRELSRSNKFRQAEIKYNHTAFTTLKLWFECGYNAFMNGDYESARMFLRHSFDNDDIPDYCESRRWPAYIYSVLATKQANGGDSVKAVGEFRQSLLEYTDKIRNLIGTTSQYGDYQVLTKETLPRLDEVKIRNKDEKLNRVLTKAITDIQGFADQAQKQPKQLSPIPDKEASQH